MSNFWHSDIGAITGRQEDAFVSSQRTIPDCTLALAKINKFTVNEYEGKQYLNIEWLLADGDYKGFKVNHKLKVFDHSPETRHRSLNMLKLIYDMFKIAPNNGDAPTDETLKVFTGKIAGIKINEIIADNGKSYNWISEVHPSEGFKGQTGVPLPPVAKAQGVESALTRNKSGAVAGLDDDIPF